MSNEAVEYVRGVPVVKTFGQTVFSFHRFKESIDDYCEFCMHYTRMMRKSMIGYTVLINSAFVFILGLTLFLIRGENYQADILLNFLFYVIFTPAIATTMSKVMFMSENRLSHILMKTEIPISGPQESLTLFGSERHCESGELYAAYHAFCARTNEFSRSRTAFYTSPEQRGFSRKKCRDGKYILGLRLAEET